MELLYNPGPEPVSFILDTDIGPDCDDAGAIAVLHALQRKGQLKTLGMMHCTSSPWGSGCLDAINTYYGEDGIPVGTLKTQGFLEGEPYTKYNRDITDSFPNRYPDGEAAPDATPLYRKLLTDSPDGSVVIAAIGPLINLMQLLHSKADDISPFSGVDLVTRKSKHLVVMGGAFPKGKEWNFEMHPEAAAYVCEHWPTSITFTGYEIGAAILTGSRLLSEAPANHPVRWSYALHLGEERTRPSWDLTAVLYAAQGASDYWDIERGRIRVDCASGANQWEADPKGPHAYLTERMAPEALAALLDELMLQMP